MNSIIHANLTVAERPAELFINDLPVLRLIPSRSAFRSFPVQQYLVTGTNEISLHIDPGPQMLSPSQRRVPPARLKASGRLARYYLGDQLDDDSGQTLALMTWSATGAEEDFPKILSQKVSEKFHYGPWLWQKAPVFTIDDTLIAEVLEFFQTLRTSLQQGDSSVYLDRAGPKYAEGARAYSFANEAEDRANFAELIAELSQQPNWKLRDIVPQDLRLRVVGHGRVLDCRRVDWEPVLLTEPMEYNLPHRFSVLLARINGRLTIVR